MIRPAALFAPRAALAAAPPEPPTVVLPAYEAEKLILHREPAQWPPEARAPGIRGVVRFTITVSPECRVEEARPYPGHPLLVEAARRAVSGYRFRPLRVRGVPARWRWNLGVRVPSPQGPAPLREAAGR